MIIRKHFGNRVVLGGATRIPYEPNELFVTADTLRNIRRLKRLLEEIETAMRATRGANFMLSYHHFPNNFNLKRLLQRDALIFERHLTERLLRFTQA